MSRPAAPAPPPPIDPARVQVIIPVLNEEASLPGVIADLHRQGLGRIRVVDNGSSDRSRQVAAACGADVLEEPRRGYGAACWRGLKDLPADVEWILFCDGDGSDDLSDLGGFLQAASGRDLVLGNRRATAAGRACLSPPQNLGNALATTLIALGWGHRYQDLGPLRLIRRQALDRIGMRDRGFGWTVEMQARAVEEGLRVEERPVAYRPRRGGRSKISGSVAGTLAAGSVILSTLAVLGWERFMQRLDPLRPGLAGLLILAGAFGCRAFGPFPRAGTVWGFWTSIGLMGLGYGLAWPLRRLRVEWFLAVALLSRLALLGMEPTDDIWRYIWEGRLQNLGFSPYAQAPDAGVLIPFRTAWWSLINHPSTSAIYPPLAQWGFRAVAALSPTAAAFKLAVTAADLAVAGLLWRRWGTAAAVLYAWNPLVLFCFAGEGHFDSWMLLPLVAAWLAFDSARQRAAGWLLGLSLAIKWVSAPIGAFLLLRTPGRWRFAAAAGLVIPLLATGLSFCAGGGICRLIPVESGFVSHQRSAELIPHLLGLVLPVSRSANWPWAIPLALVVVLLLRTGRSFCLFAERYLMALLMLSPIVHAWYLTWLVPFSVASRNAGTGWVSVSAFVYYVLRQRQEAGDLSWQLTAPERFIFWGPLLAGALWSEWRRRQEFARA